MMNEDVLHNIDRAKQLLRELSPLLDAYYAAVRESGVKLPGHAHGINGALLSAQMRLTDAREQIEKLRGENAALQSRVMAAENEARFLRERLAVLEEQTNRREE